MNTVVLMLQAGTAQELRRSSPGRDALLEGWMCPLEGDEVGMCSSSSHWLLPTQLVLLSPRDCPPLLLGDLCMNPEGKGMGHELQVLQPQGLLVSSKNHLPSQAIFVMNGHFDLKLKCL